MKTIVFAVAGYNLAETGRHIEIAKACKGLFNIVFMSYGGAYEEMIEQEGFKLVKMEPRLTEHQLHHVRKALSGETLNTVGYFTAQEMEPRVNNELEFFKKLKPACVLTGWCQSVMISARVAKVPFINVLHSTSITEYYQEGLQTWPDRTNFKFLRLFFTERHKKEWVSRQILNMKWPARPFNKLAKKYGLDEFKNFIDVLEGDHILLADIPEWVNLHKVRSKVHYIGPLPFRMNIPVPKFVHELDEDKPIVYFAMGSSGKPRLIKEIIEGFEGKPYSVIAPVASHIQGMHVNIPENVLVTGFLPAHKVNPMADISVIHGGQNTVMNACLSATPIVGVGMHPEQQANLDACVRKGFAIRLNKKRVTPAKIFIAIEKLLGDKKAKKKVSKFSEALKEWDGPINAANFLYDTYGKVTGDGITNQKQPVLH